MLSLHKKISKKKSIADVEMAQRMHWLTKYTNKECHTVIYAFHNTATLFNNHPYIK